MIVRQCLEHSGTLAHHFVSPPDIVAAFTAAGVCVAQCDKSLVAWGTKQIGGVCRDPFTCRALDGCVCPLDGCLTCEVLAGTAKAVCTRCEPNRHLVEGKCSKAITCRRSKVRITKKPCACIYDMLFSEESPLVPSQARTLCQL